MTDLHNDDLAKARDAFMADDREGAKLADWRTMKYLRSDCAPYLRNRIEAAFVAGWNACSSQGKEVQP